MVEKSWEDVSTQARNMEEGLHKEALGRKSIGARDSCGDDECILSELRVSFRRGQ